MISPLPRPAGEKGRESAASGAARLDVRLSALKENYREALRRASPAACAPVVKADAYSLGMIPVAKALAEAGADTFFVARLSEGMALRAASPRARIFVLDGLAPGTAEALISYRLTPVLNSLDEIQEWSAIARARNARLDAVIHIDTGMNRSGLGRGETHHLAANARDYLGALNLALIMSHLACADEKARPENLRQLERFRAALAMLPPAPASLAATSGIELGRDFMFDLVRPGLGLYGGHPDPEGARGSNPYKTVAVLTAPVLQVRRVEKGETVGYGCAFTASKPTMLVTVAFGYADGMLRAAGAKGRAALGGVKIPYAGRISMDLVTLDAGEVPVGHLQRGAEVEFLGDTISIEAVASAAGSIGHEVLTAIHPRAVRQYVE